MTLVEMLQLQADEIERQRAIDTGPSLVTLLRDAVAELLAAAMLRARMETLTTDLDNAARRHAAHWEPERGKAMLEVAFELKALLAQDREAQQRTAQHRL